MSADDLADSRSPDDVTQSINIDIDDDDDDDDDARSSTNSDRDDINASNTDPIDEYSP